MNGGADEIRTRDLLHAMQSRSQLRHGPTYAGRGSSLATRPRKHSPRNHVTQYTRFCGTVATEPKRSTSMIQPVQHIWAPWRVAFIKADRPAGCFFCEAARADRSQEAAPLLLAPTGPSLAMLKRFPHSNRPR